MWQAIIHCIFILSALGIAAVERIQPAYPAKGHH
jgi:hypothetical protein